MSSAATPAVGQLSKGRSAVSNGTRLLQGIDGRSVAARRLRDLAKDFATPYGGLGNLSEPDKALVMLAAGLTVENERLQACIARGEVVDHDALIRLSSEARRALRGIRRQEVSSAPTLSDYLAQKRGAAA